MKTGLYLLPSVIEISMADADSLHEANSDLELDPTAGDADVEDDEAPTTR